MRLSISRSKNSTCLYVIRSTYVNGKHSSQVVEKLGTLIALREKLEGRDPLEWANEHIAKLNEEERVGTRQIHATFSPTKQIPMGTAVRFNGGYLFLQAIYYGLGMENICREIKKKHKFEYDLNAIVSRLVYTRILYPSSKLSSLEAARKFIEQPKFELHQMYRALDVIAKESQTIEAEVYHSSKKLVERNTRILYYDCTNYFFEIEQEDGLKQYGLSKEHRPNPIVQMGLFMDGSGIPLAMSIHGGAENEQPTLKPIEERIAKDFELSKFIVCTDAGLGSLENRLMNNVKDRAFIVTQSLKKMKGFLIKWALDSAGWKIHGQKEIFNLTQIDDSSDNPNTYYKERWINEDGLEQKLIVSFSPKYKAYQREVRARQIKRAQQMVSNPQTVKRKKQNHPSRFVKTSHCTQDGEVAKASVVSLDIETITKEEKFDGFYGVCTNLDEEVAKIVQINKGRWEIEESFRILKSEFRARPVFLSREARIKAHFTTCFLSLLVYRILERRLDQRYTVEEIIHTLRDMDFCALNEEGFIPSYSRDALSDALHDAFAFRTDSQIVPKKKMAHIIRQTINPQILLKNG